MRLVVALLSTGFTAALFAAEQPSPNYYPLAKGTKWEYRISDEESEMAVQCEITDVETKNGKTHGRMEAKFPNAVTMGEELYADSLGIYRTAFCGVKLSQPVAIVKYPAKSGDSWKEAIKLGGMEGTVTITIKDAAATIEVPAGKFVTLAVHSVVEVQGHKSVARIWYANGVGIVKQESICGEKTMRMELMKFYPAK